MIHLNKQKQIFQIDGEDVDIAIEIGNIIGAWMLKRKWDKNISFEQSRKEILYISYQIIKDIEKELGTYDDKQNAIN